MARTLPSPGFDVKGSSFLTPTMAPSSAPTLLLPSHSHGKDHATIIMVVIVIGLILCGCVCGVYSVLTRFVYPSSGVKVHATEEDEPA